MNGLTFHQAGTDHRGAVGALLKKSYPRLLAPAYPPELLARAMPWLIAPQEALLASGTYYIARDRRGADVAAGGWTAGAPGGGKVTPGLAHVRHVVTDPDRLREGIGRALVSFLCEGARARGHDRIEALSTLNAERFYAACGFRVIERVLTGPPDDRTFPAVRMQAAL